MRTSHEKLQAVLISKSLSLIFSNLTMVRIVALRAYQHLKHIFVCVLLNLAQPRLHVIKCLHVRRVECKQNTMRSLVIRLCDGAESLLACRVPNLQLHAFSIDLHIFNLKVNTCLK